MQFLQIQLYHNKCITVLVHELKVGEYTMRFTYTRQVVVRSSTRFEESFAVHGVPLNAGLVQADCTVHAPDCTANRSADCALLFHLIGQSQGLCPAVRCRIVPVGPGSGASHW
jgi:hypothetical protein